MNYLEAMIVLFAVVDPLGNLPIFLDVTENLGPSDSKKAFNSAVLVGLITLLIFTFAGKQILTGIFHIGIEDISIAGGLLLVVIAIDNLFGSKFSRISSLKQPVGAYELGAVPLGVPLLAGPGAMVTSLTILEKSGPFVTLTSIIVVFVFTWVMVLFVDPIHKFLGRLVSQVFSKVMSLFIAAIGIHMALNGITTFVRQLAAQH